MRKLNAFLAITVLALFIIHGVLGSLNMMNIAPVISKALSHTMLTLVAAHALISLFFTLQTVIKNVKTGAPYLKENRLFWSRRISGFLIMVLIFFHLTAFNTSSGGVFRLVPFDPFKLTAQLLLVVSLAVHIIVNVKPMLISFGVRKLRPRAGDILFFVSVMLLFMAIGFIIYYIRWQT